MNEERIHDLVRKFNEGQATPEEIAEIEQLIASGRISPEDMTVLRNVQDPLHEMEMPSPSTAMDDRFYAMLEGEMRRKGFLVLMKNRFTDARFLLRVAVVTLVFVVGAGIGRYYGSSLEDNQVKELSHQLTALREMMLLSLLEKDAATERLKAVNLTHEMTTVSAKVTNALLQTLNNDENVNVRLAALEALKPYVQDSFVRAELIRSIVRQESPLVQVALAELMAALQEKSSVKELQKILRDEQTPADIRKKIKESIDAMS